MFETWFFVRFEGGQGGPKLNILAENLERWG